MLREAIFAALLVTVAVGLPVGDDQDHDHSFVLSNITSIWEELHDLRQEINHHMHEGHEEVNHDQALQEVETLHHEHHVHHLHHPHEGHNEHHDTDMLRHLTEVHGHMDHHGEGPSAHAHGHGHGHSHDHHQGHHDGDGHHDDHDDHEHTPHENEDIHDTHGLHSHEDEHEYSHEHKAHKACSSHDHHHHHHKGHSDVNFDDDNEHDDDDDDDDSNERPRPGPARRGLALIPGRGDANGQSEDPWMYATCSLEPNVEMPESHAKGTIVISQRKDKKGPVFFDLHLEDVDVSQFGTIHGFHVHENPVAGGSCGSTGGHFNPEGTDHGAPEDDVRHVGDLGNVEVDENGEMHGHIVSDKLVALQGPHSIVGKALVLHAGEDDMGKGGYADSLTTGHAGARLACCTIHIKVMPYFRFKG